MKQSWQATLVPQATFAGLPATKRSWDSYHMRGNYTSKVRTRNHGPSQAKSYTQSANSKFLMIRVYIAGINMVSATDRFNALAVDVLPFLFVGKNDPDKSVNETFGKAWSENTGGTGAIKLYSVEIVEMTKTHLTSKRWAIKQTAALSLADVCKSIGSDLSAEQLHVLWPVLVSATSGKSWDGKEAVLDALVSLAVNGKAHLGKDEGRLEDLRKVKHIHVVQSDFWLIFS